MIRVASRWLEWFEKKITGPSRSSRSSVPYTRSESSWRTSGSIAPLRIARLAAVPTFVRAQSVGNPSSSTSSTNGSAERGTRGRRPHRNPVAIDLSSSRQPAIVRLPQRTSAIMIGGAWKYVIEGEDPTVSEAISSASRSESARR
jgi:hypothetical protein